MSQANVTPCARISRPGLALALVAISPGTIGAGAARAQGMSNSGSQFNTGYGRNGSLNSPVDIRTRDDNNNQVFVNGAMDTPSGSVFSRASGFSQSRSGGVGGSGLATAIGNNLVVVVEGSWNRVVVNSTQINNGDVSAGASLNGSINLE